MSYKLKIVRNKYFIFCVGIACIIFVSGTLKINQNIANKSQGYFVLQNIEQANEAGKLGYIKYEINDYAKVFGIDRVWKPGMDRMRIIRSGPEDFDDIGYISFLELIAIAGKEINLLFVEKLHNTAFIFSLIILSFIIVKLFNNIFAGWIFMFLALILKSKILSLIYGSPDSRTFVIFFPILVISVIFGLNWVSSYLNRLWAWALVLLFSILIGIIASIRSSEGMAALYAILFCIVFFRVTFKQKALSVVALMAGYFLIIFIMPIIFALHRDIKTGEFNGDISLYLQTTGRHQAWHSIVLGMGKYPNSIGMRYDDIVCYDILRSRYSDAMDPVHNYHGKGYYSGLQGIYFNYITKHPLEYVKNVIKAYAELFYFIPYATSVGNLTWWRYGYLPKKPGVVAEDWDMPMRIDPHGENLLVLKYRYLRLTPMEWTVFVLSLFTIIHALRSAIYSRVGENNRSVFLYIAFYIFLLATQRAIVPNHGLSLIVGFWIFSILSLLYICFTNNRVRGYLYWKVRAFNIGNQ